MLALAYAAAHPRRVKAIVMISSGTFDRAARNRMTSIQAERTDDNARRRLDQLREQFSNDRLRSQGKLIQELDSYEPIPTDAEFGVVDKRAYQETWQDMMQLQEQGVYPSAFASIREPVIMLHGDYDSHPGGMIRASLEPHIPQLEYREWKRCGHYPWREKVVRNEFVAVLREWVTQRFTEGLPNTEA